MTTELETTIRRLADLDAIRDLACRYAHCVWQNDARGASELFVGPGVMDTGDGEPMLGRTAIVAAYDKAFGDLMLKPFVHNHVIDLDGEQATGTCYLDLRTVEAGNSMIGCGHYDDCYSREQGIWYFKSRKLNMDFLVPS